MASTRDQRERELFEACLGLDPPRWEAFLEKAAPGDADLKARVLRLLASHEDPGALASDVVHGPPPQLLDAPEQVGPYRILERIGAGGMGVVFLAEQLQPIRRKVALKVIKAGMDTKEVIARFESERQALALMDHPSIARILDAGATDSGRPYFVMEYVRGVPITEYADRRRLTVDERLRLFITVLGAVQHAHQKGVIHRDLKPSNILIAETDGVPVPKVIDFGVAKATNQKLSELTLHTRLGAMIGTPDYMSPEQAEMTALDVDTRSDVYALGVVLYELLAGVRPFDLAHKSLLQIRHALVEQAPAAPSVRITSKVASDRSATERQLTRTLQGDLDRVTLKALLKEPRHRYQTALAFGEDLERFLADEPVKARAPSLAYRAGKFMRRHAGAVTGLTAAAVLVAALIALYTVFLTEERDRAAREAATAEEVTEFLVEMFTAADPNEARGASITARELLDRGARRILADLDERPEVQTRLLQTMGRVYLELGLADQARPLVERAVASRRESPEAQPQDLADSLNLLGEICFSLGLREEAQEYLVEALELRRSALGDRHPDVGESLNNVGAVFWFQGDFETAEGYYREALALREALLGRDHPDVLESMNNLAVLLQSAGDPESAEPLYREVLESRAAQLGEDHPRTLNSAYNLGALLSTRRDYAAARPLLEETLEVRRRVLGDEHPEILEVLQTLVAVLWAMGDSIEALPLAEETLALQRQLRGTESSSLREAVDRMRR